MAEQRVKINEFVQAGLINDMDITVTKARFVRWDYGQYAPDDTKFVGSGPGPEVTALILVMEPKSGDPAIQMWSVGGEEDFVPSKDGEYLIKNGDRSSLAKGSNFSILEASMENCLGEKLPDALNDAISGLEGLEGHILRIPAPKREGLQNVRKHDDGTVREQTVLTFNDIKSVPWDKGKKKSSRKSNKSESGDSEESSKSSKASSNGDAPDVASKLVRKAIMDAGGEMDLGDLAYAVYQIAPKDKVERKAITDLVDDTKFVSGIEGVSVKGDKITLD
jgi:hypothetical protein